MADSKLTALSALSVPALEDLLYAVDDPSGTPASAKVTGSYYGGLLARGICNARLTTESGVPVSTSDRASQSTIYLTPINGGLISLYDGTRWRLYLLTEISLALSGLTSGKNYDVFVYDNAGTLTLELSAAWTNDSTRADALALQDGVTVKSGAETRRWIGTIRTTGTTTTEDSVTKRFVWNAYNRVARGLLKRESTSSWTYNSATVRQANGSSANQVEVVVGDVGCVELTLIGVCSATVSAVGVTVIGKDSTSAGAANIIGGYSLYTGGNASADSNCSLFDQPAAGYHYYAWLESCGAAVTLTFYGDSTIQKCGLAGYVLG